MDLVSVIIPTYNRFHYLLNTIKSVQEQTYKNIEIIVVNDCSTQKEYYNYDWTASKVTIIHLHENSKTKFGFGCAGHVRNQGIKISNGKYIAFCDDDDIWFPNKVESQINAMKMHNCKMSSSDGYIGIGPFDKNKKYKKCLEEYYFEFLKKGYRMKGSNLLDNGFPTMWNLDFCSIHNCMICSSVIVEKEILDVVNNFQHLNHGEDYDCWKRCLQHTNSVYVNDVLFYYDLGHGDGQNY